MIASRTIAILVVFFSFANVIPATASFSGASDPDFFWLPPTVPAKPTPTGPFDATALDELVIEICQLVDGVCTGPLVERMSAGEASFLNRIRVYPRFQFYAAEWLSALSHVQADQFYRVRVLRNGIELGFLDVQMVKRLRDLGSVDRSQYLGMVKGTLLPLWFRIEQPSAHNRVTINEVESSVGTPGDWVELYNTAAAPVSLDGYIIKDNDDTHSYTLPAGTMIPARGYYVIEESALDFGLGANDAVRFFTPDGALIVDSYNWAAHALTTYGRCPNGTGAFQTNTTVTKGAANDCSIVISINEVESSGGTPGDWVELYNPGPGPANLAGFVFKDNDDAHSYALPASVVPAGGYLLLEEAALGFGLGTADSARLFRPDGSVADAYTWTAHATTTYGRCPNGIGAFATTVASTKGAANLCVVPATPVHINEVESSGGVPGDWIELINTGATQADLSGWLIRDNDDTHNYFLPAGTAIAAGGYLVVEEVALGFGLGAADAVRLYDSAGALFESYDWAAHALTTTYGRCPNGTGAFITTTSVTKGAANDCGVPVPTVHINEAESSGGVPGDWVELYNYGGAAVDVSGFVFRDSDDTHTYTIPAGTTVAAGGYYLLEEAAFVFGLGGADSARLFDTTGTLIDSFAWAVPAATTYGRCPNGTGAFAETASSTKGTANTCAGDPLPWPGDADVQTADGLNVFGGNMSGLVYEGSGSPTPGVLWGARNGPGALFRLVWDGTIWTPDSTNGWGAGKLLAYPGDTGSPDAEGVTFAGPSSSGGMYVATERDNNASGVSRNSILRFDVTGAGATLTATHEWNLTADLPVVGPNLGMEAITWIPDEFLVSQIFVDESKSPTSAYNPADYPNHGTGLFFVGLEANGTIYAYALDHVGGGFTRVATIASGFPGVMDLHFDRELNNLWAVCDDTCQGQSAVLRIGVGTGMFVVTQKFDRPGMMPNLNNEGFAITPLTECVGNLRPGFWADDSETGGHAIRRGTLTCAPF